MPGAHKAFVQTGGISLSFQVNSSLFESAAISVVSILQDLDVLELGGEILWTKPLDDSFVTFYDV